MKKLLSTLLCIFLAQSIHAQTPSKVVGIYQWCIFHCETIKVNADFTFDFLVSGDIYGTKKAYGTWKFAGKDTVSFVSKTIDEKLYIASYIVDGKEFDISDKKIPISSNVVGFKTKLVFRNNKLCRFEKNKIINCFRKISDKAEQKLFPKN